MSDYPLQIDPVILQLTGKVTIPASSGGGATRGLDAVVDLGMDPSGKVDCSQQLSNYLSSSQSWGNTLYFPKGMYRFDNTVYSNAKNVKLVGDGALQNMGDSGVIFFADKSIPAILHWNSNSTAANMNGPRIENIQFQDRSSGHNVLGCALRLEACANSEIRIGLLNLRTQRYTQGTVTVTNNSKTVTLSGGTWQQNWFQPSWFVVDGYPYEIASIDSGSQLTLAIKYQGPTANGKGYAINWCGVGVWCDPGYDFTQYGKDWSLNGRCACALFASAGSTSPRYTGTSRIKIKSGYLNGEGIADSMACYLGPFSDTFVWDVAMNSYAYGVIVANGHQNDLQHLDVENAGGPPPVTGLPTAYNSCRGVLVISDNNNDSYGNRIGGYFRQCGTGIELAGNQGQAPQWTILSACTFRSNKINFINGNATNTQTLGQVTLFEEDQPPSDETYVIDSRE